MDEIARQKPAVSSKRHVDPVRSLKKTLREHYEERRARYGIDTPNIFDRELRRLFSDAPEHARAPSAAAFLRRIRGELRRIVAQWTGEYRYTIDQVLGELIDRCRELNLRLHRPYRDAKQDALVLLTVLTMNYIHGGHHRIAL
jgi:hypothetical protein